jgi:hypothetical protein
VISRRAWIIMTVLVLAYGAGIALDVTPLLRGPEDWRWPRAVTQHWDRLWPLALVWLGTLGWVGVIDRSITSGRHPRRWLALGLAGLLAASVLVQLAALRMERADALQALFWRATDYYANGYFTVGAGLTDVGAFLRQYPALMPNFPLHPQVHPPGLPVIYWLTSQALSVVPGGIAHLAPGLRALDCNNFLVAAMPDQPLAGAVAGMLWPTLANALVVLCVYQLARVRFGRRAGFFAAALWVGVPSAVIFMGSWSQLYPLLACLAWLSLDAGLQRRRLRWFVLAGFALGLSTFMELGTAALALFMVVYVLARYAVERRHLWRDWKFLGAGLIAGVSGTLSVWIAYRIVFGVSLNEVVAAMWPIHTGYQFDRLTWIFNHPYEFLVFVGLPLAVLMGAAWWRAVQQWRAGQAADPLSLSLIVSLVVLSVLDPARDETARTWLIFMPLAVAAASQALIDPAQGRRRMTAVWLLLGAQVAVMLLFMRFVALAPIPEVDVRTAAPPPDAVAASAEFDGGLQMQSYRLTHSAPDQWVADFYWQPRVLQSYPYSVFAHLLDAQGQLVGQQDTWPAPYMTCWTSGGVYLDHHVILLPPDRSAAPVRLAVGVYNAETGQRVPVRVAGQSFDQITLDLPALP